MVDAPKVLIVDDDREIHDLLACFLRKHGLRVETVAAGEVYVNYLGQESDEGLDQVEAAYGREKYARLVELKRRYDPDNLFRLNQNIRPSAGPRPTMNKVAEPLRTGAPA